MHAITRSRWWKPIARLIIFCGVLLLALSWTFDHFFAARPSASDLAWARRHQPAGGGELKRLWRVPPFRGLTQEGRPIDAAALAGSVWVADFIYTRCTSACPTLTAHMMLLARRLPPGVRLLSFSVDPTFDRPEVLAAYTRRWPQPPLPWTLISPDSAAFEPLVRGMNVVVDHDPDDAADITHSNQLFLIDRAGWVRGVYDSQAEVDLAALTSDAAAIVGRAAPSTPDSLATGGDPKELGHRLFGELGCNGCHADVRTAPPLGGFGGRRVVLENGTTVATDRAYLRASILRPWAQVVRGYGASMPTYDGALTETQLAGLLAYLESLPAPQTAASSGTAVDPVCHMKVAIVDATPRLQQGPTTYYFCSSTCRARFSDHPGRYATDSAPKR
ncbi:MAG TPA: SCO family protein [Polyangia bacterium]|nr:SCO family protein [Polyangia bacterium]